ncbi:MAG: P-II family nitrogen regulator [Planctomycetota bacterium]
MKLVLAIVQPTKLNAVRTALTQVGVSRLTVCDAQGYGRQRGQTATYRGIEYKVSMLRKLAIEVWVNDDLLESAVDAIQNASRTGSEGAIGDGKIFVLPTENALTLDGIEGPSAL